MGADGGSIPDRKDLVKNKPRQVATDGHHARVAQYSLCALSKRPLVQPVVLDQIGKLYNKVAILEFLLDRTTYGDGESICGYIRSMKDTTTLTLTPNPNRPSDAESVSTDVNSLPSLFICPLSLKEMNGSLPFVALRPCGCVFALAALKAIIASTPLSPPTTSSSGSDGDDSAKSSSAATGKKSKTVEGASLPCPQCSTPFVPGYQTKDDPTAGSIMAINLPTEEQEDARIALIGVREAQAAAKKAEKAASGGKKRKSEVRGGVDGEKKKSKKADKGEVEVESVVVVPLPKGKAPGGRLIPKSVADELAAAEERRKLGGMSAAVSSLYAPKDGKKEEKHGNDNWMTRGAFTRYA